MKAYRKFNGKTYKLNPQKAATKKEANAIANWVRKHGINVRIVKIAAKPAKGMEKAVPAHYGFYVRKSKR